MLHLGKLGTCPLIFPTLPTPALTLPVTMGSQLLPNQQNELCFHLLQVGGHGPRHVQQDAHFVFQDVAK